MLRRETCLVVVAGGLLACGGEAPVPVTPTAEVSPRPPEKPKNAAQLADDLVRARIHAWVYPPRASTHPLLPRIFALPPVRGFVTGWDPTRDLEQVYIAAPGGRAETAVVFAEHRLDDATTDALLGQWIAASDPPGEKVAGSAFPAAILRTHGRGGVVGFAPPHFMISLPVGMEDRLGAFSATGGLGDARTDKAALVVMDQPSETLKGTGAPKIPESISVARVEVDLRPDGGAVVALDADSQSPTQAAEDARYLEKTIDRMTSVQLGPITIRAFKKVEITSLESKVKSRVSLTKGELEMLLGLLESQLR